MELVDREELLRLGEKATIKTAVGNWDELDNKAKAAVLRYAVYVRKVFSNLDAVEAIEPRTVIDRFDWALNYIEAEKGAYFTGMRNALRWCKCVIDGNAPDCETVPDFVEVVRCKECRYRDPEDRRCEHHMNNNYFTRDDDGFCSYGKWRAEDE